MESLVTSQDSGRQWISFRSQFSTPKKLMVVGEINEYEFSESKYIQFGERWLSERACTSICWTADQ